MTTPSILSRLALTVVLALVFSGAAKAAEVCYGIFDTGGCDSRPLTVAASLSPVSLPNDIIVQTAERATLRISPRGAAFVGTAGVLGGTVVTSAPETLVVVCDRTCAVILPKVAGMSRGSTLVADVRLWAPNGETQEFFNGPITLAVMDNGSLVIPGEQEFNAVAWILNPASNTTQRTFLRFIATGDTAEIVLYATDDNGDERGPLVFTVPAGGAVQLTPADIENGAPAKGIAYGVGAGVGKWVIRAGSSVPFRLFGLSTGPSGGLAQLPTE